MAKLSSLTINDTGFIGIPAGTASQRPGASSQPAVNVGQTRFNTDSKSVESYTGVNNLWRNGFVSNSSQPADRYLVYTFEANNDARSPNFCPLGGIDESMPGVNAVPWNTVNRLDWKRVICTSARKPGVQFIFNKSDNATNLPLFLRCLLNKYANWPVGSNVETRLTIGSGSWLSQGTQVQFMHNNGGGETHDIVTIGVIGGYVWSTGMYWGNIDAVSNYGGILNTMSPHSGGSLGNTGDKLLVYVETDDITATKFTNYLTPTGPFGNATTFSWTTSTTAGQAGSMPALADATDITSTANWSSFGYQHQANDAWIQVDLGTAQSFDYTFAIGYPGAGHWSDLNYIEASNSTTSVGWTRLAEWKYHPGAGASTGYLLYSNGSHVYSNTINNVNKWIKLYNNGAKYRYWRIGGTNFNASNGYQLLQNWALLKRNNT